MRRTPVLFLTLLSAPAVAEPTDPFTASFAELAAAPLALELDDHENHVPSHFVGARPDGHAPIGVMGDHLHHAGGVMLSYRHMTMHMEGNRDGTYGLSTQQVFDTPFLVVPLEMTMEMHMVGAMVAPSDDVTLMGMFTWIDLEMEHVAMNPGGPRFTTKASGPGDTRLAALVRLWEGERQSVHLNAGLSLPTGSINERDATPASSDAKLPYPMQLGSGTFDLVPGVTYVGQTDDWSWGAQWMSTVRLGENSERYTLGDRHELGGWGARRLNDTFSVSLRLRGSTWGDVEGADPELNPMMVQTADTNRQGGSRLDAFVGLNAFASEGALAGHRIAIEIGAPVWQDLDGPQLETDLIATVGWRYAP